MMTDSEIRESRKALAPVVSTLNRAGANLQVRANPGYGRQKVVGGTDDAPLLLTGRDATGRRLRVKGTAGFIAKVLETQIEVDRL